MRTLTSQRAQRMKPQHSYKRLCRGYVALAVASAQGTVTREITTGSARRDNNMVAFAEEALKLLLKVLQEDSEAVKECAKE